MRLREGSSGGLPLLVGAFVVGVGSTAALSAGAGQGVPQNETASKLETVAVKVRNLGCASCVPRIKKTIESIEGVTGADVDAKTKTAAVRYDAATITPQQIVDKLNEHELSIPRVAQRSVAAQGSLRIEEPEAEGTR